MDRDRIKFAEAFIDRIPAGSDAGDACNCIRMFSYPPSTWDGLSEIMTATCSVRAGVTLLSARDSNAPNPAFQESM